MICKSINSLLVILFLNTSELISYYCLHTVKWFQIFELKYFYSVLIIFLNSLKWFHILLSSIDSFICTQLNAFKHQYVTLTIQFRHAIKGFQVWSLTIRLFMSYQDTRSWVCSNRLLVWKTEMSCFSFQMFFTQTYQWNQHFFVSCNICGFFFLNKIFVL